MKTWSVPEYKTEADPFNSKDATPLGGRPNPLTPNTIQDIKDCFALISEREKELAEKLNFDQAKPYYGDDEPPNAKVISFVKPSKE